jgi:peptidase E
MEKLLECKICGYKAKQLHQHIKAVHKMSTAEYRKKFGANCIMQIGFTPPAKRSAINENYSNQVKETYKKLDKQLRSVKEIYSKEETKIILQENNL